MQVPLILLNGSGHPNGLILCLGLLRSLPPCLPPVPGLYQGCYLWGSSSEWHLPTALLWLGPRAQPPPTKTPAGPAPGPCLGRTCSCPLSQSPWSMEPLPGAWRGCGGQPSAQWIRGCPGLSSSWWCWDFSSDQTPGWAPALSTLASQARPFLGWFDQAWVAPPSGQILPWLLS